MEKPELQLSPGGERKEMLGSGETQVSVSYGPQVVVFSPTQTTEAASVGSELADAIKRVISEPDE